MVDQCERGGLVDLNRAASANFELRSASGSVSFYPRSQAPGSELTSREIELPKQRQRPESSNACYRPPCPPLPRDKLASYLNFLRFEKTQVHPFRALASFW